MASLSAAERASGGLLQRVDVVLNRGADALADADRLESCEPDVPRIAGLEERCDPQRRAGVRRLADAVVGHQNQCPVVGFQREANVEPVAAVGTVGDPVAGRRLHRRLETRTFEAATDDLHDRARPLRAVFDDRAGPGFGAQRAEIFEGWDAWLLGGILGARGGCRRPGGGWLSDSERTGRGQSEADQQRGCDTHGALLY